MPAIRSKRRSPDGHGADVLPIGAIPRSNTIRPSSYFRWKGSLDRALALLLLLVPGLPLMGLLMLLVRLTSRGPGIYRQERVGKDGRRFVLYKIRTMSHDAEARTGAVWTQADDPRVTRVGRVLRTLHLDELPQLFNVLRGEMSLVGPRPERPEFVYLLSAEIPGYMDRLAVRPGVTGLAQLNLPPDSDLASVQRKLVLDLEYVRTAGLVLDLRLLLCTFGRIFKLPVLRLLGLRRSVQLTAVCSLSPGALARMDLAALTPANVLIPVPGNSPDHEPASPEVGRSRGQGNGEAMARRKPR